ncbi:YdiU family protein [Gammaproteobacteria bacterium]|nr:YdiU family protein [Gammaproteobacteria bacterium]
MNAIFPPKKLDELHFDNSFIETLPADTVTENYTRQVNQACYSTVTPTKFPQASLIAYSAELAEEIGLDPQECTSDNFVQVFSGNRLLSQMRSYANCYGGHQFGNWAGQLGDGRAINLGEVLSQSGQRWALQLKGAGPTPYSRTADGLAVLRSSVREFLCSEAMFHLGVPTTRALSLISTGEMVERDMFYDGNPKLEPGAIVCRVAPSFTRFGSFEIFTSRNQLDILKQLADYTIAKDFPHLLAQQSSPSGKPDRDCYINWFREVCQLTATMIVHWMRVGFVHGVMNTDNMSILGLTIDYGPYGWLEDYDPGWTPNTTDAQGRRYRFGQQAQVALWNLAQLANAIYPLIEAAEPLEAALEEYKQFYDKHWRDMLADKLGLTRFTAASDEDLIKDLFATLQTTETDMSIFFRKLAEVDTSIDLSTLNHGQILTPIKAAFYSDDIGDVATEKFCQWLLNYQQRVKQDDRQDKERQQQMNAVNPHYVLRNYLAQQAIDKSEQGDHSMIYELMEVLKNPYTEQAGKAHLAAKRPEWARHRAGCSMLSCSS